MAQHYAAGPWTLWKRGVRRGLLTLKRQREWTVLLGALTGMFFLLHLISLAILGLEGLGSVIGTQGDVRLELQRTADNQSIQEFITNVKNLPYVTSATYVTREQVLSRMKEEDPALITQIEELNLENPFPDTLAVELQSARDYGTLLAFLGQSQWNEVVNLDALQETSIQGEYLQELQTLSQVSRSLVLVFLVLVTLVLLFTASELVRGRAKGRSEEILIEYLSGAQTSSILIPFATEATLLLAGALLLSAALLTGILFALPIVAPVLTASGALAPVRSEVLTLTRQFLPLILVLELLITPILAWIGTWLAVLPRLSMRSPLLHR